MFHITTLQQFLCFSVLLTLLPCAIAQQATTSEIKLQKPQLQLATKYHQDAAVEDYWVSEKLDGVRGYWNGQQLLTRNGNVLSPPAWFVANWPKIAMGGELWSERGQFEQISACVRRKHSDGKCWKNLKLMIFDLPHQTDNFTARITTMKQLIQASNATHLAMIQQTKLTNNADLYAL